MREDQATFSKLLSPQVLRSLSNVQVAWLSCGFEHCLALTSDGLIASWGCGASGSLGHNDYLSYTEPKMIEPEVLKDVSYVECGGYHSAAVTKAGKLFMWGRSDVGQLGLPKDKVIMDEHGYVMKQPMEVAYFSDITVKAVALGEAHSVVLDCEGQVYTFGWGELGQLGVQNSRTFQVYKIFGTPAAKVVKVASGAVFSLALTSDGKVYSWGSGQNGQLGLGNSSNTTTFVPTLVENLSDFKVLDIQCGESHSLAVTECNSFFAWGQGFATSPSLIKHLKDLSPTKNSQKDKQLDVISYYPKLLSKVDNFQTLVLPNS